MPSTEPPVVHDNLISWDGALLTRKSSIALEGSYQGLDQASVVTLVLAPIPKEALPPEQLQHVLGPYLEKLFDDPAPPEEQPTMVPAAETEEAGVVPKPGTQVGNAVIVSMLSGKDRTEKETYVH
ncbi:hypothetical protein KIL84_019668 [Mauremys mutica]|uniref:Uncharacterized protein n=1 Tax=Mauremys mutica TaxID=74926 RepID=A0A9D3XU89_9SAUR|nr:hypothetical protein KIL84_019668 [Mauremys mutica]